MGVQNYRVSYFTGSVWTALTNVQSIGIQHGRQRQLDAYQTSRCSIVIRYPNGFASPINALIPGASIRVENITGTAQKIFEGNISDVQVQYGIPYASNVGPSDYLTISCEGALAIANRANGNGATIAQDKIGNQLPAASGLYGFGAFYQGNAGDALGPTLSGTTVNGSWGDWITRCALTINGRIWDGYNKNEFYVVSPFYTSTCGFNFSDTTNNATNQVYDTIEFASYADNYYTQARVTPEAVSAVTVDATGAVAPFRTYQINTLNSSTSQATDLGQYLVNTYSTTAPKIVSVSCSAEAQNVFKLDQCGTTVSGGPGAAPGNRVTITFRGTTVNCVIEGVSITASPESSRYTYYVSGADLNNYLILDNTVFGTLDNNRLGY